MCIRLVYGATTLKRCNNVTELGHDEAITVSEDWHSVVHWVASTHRAVCSSGCRGCDLLPRVREQKRAYNFTAHTVETLG